MKVGIVCAFDTYFDRLALLKEYYEEKGAQVIVYSSNFSHRQKEKLEHHPLVDVMVPTKPYHKNLSIARLRSHVDFSREVKKLLEKTDFDLVHVMVPCNSLVKYVPKHQFKLVFDVIDLWPETLPISRFKNWFPFTVWKNMRDKEIDQADLIFMECKLYQSVLQKVEDKKYKTLYWARKEEPMKTEVQLRQEEVRFCYLGSINHIIDIDFIVNLLKECAKYRRVSIDLIGDGESKNELIQSLKQYGIHVKDHGKVYDQKEKQAIFDGCNFGLNVMKESVVVGLTMKSLDYMCAGLPIINTIGGDTKDFCSQYDMGFHVPHDQIGVAAQKICSQTIMENQMQRTAIQKLYRDHFTKDSFFETMDQAMEDLL